VSHVLVPAVHDVPVLATVIVVHAPQLLSSLLSVTIPGDKVPLFVLSAQARAEYVPDEGKVYDFVVSENAPLVRVFMLTEARSVIVPPPFAAVATCIKLLNGLLPVDAFPLFVILALNVTAVPAVAVVGEMTSAMRSGVGLLVTRSVFVSEVEDTPSALVQVTV